MMGFPQSWTSEIIADWQELTSIEKFEFQSVSFFYPVA
jgi:hypothetical protein